MQRDYSFGVRSRRWFLRVGAAWSAAIVACRSKTAGPGALEPRTVGAPVSSYGARSRFENAARFFNRDTKRSEEHTSELQSPYELVCCLLREKKNSM